MILVGWLRRHNMDGDVPAIDQGAELLEVSAVEPTRGKQPDGGRFEAEWGFHHFVNVAGAGEPDWAYLVIGANFLFARCLKADSYHSITKYNPISVALNIFKFNNI